MKCFGGRTDLEGNIFQNCLTHEWLCSDFARARALRRRSLHNLYLWLPGLPIKREPGPLYRRTGFQGLLCGRRKSDFLSVSTAIVNLLLSFNFNHITAARGY